MIVLSVLRSFYFVIILLRLKAFWCKKIRIIKIHSILFRCISGTKTKGFGKMALRTKSKGICNL